MAKKKKTKQQKIIADVRRQLFKKNLSNHKIEEKNPTVEKITPQINTQKKDLTTAPSQEKNDINNYAYLMHDLRKTATLTGSIITLQILLYLSLTHKILVLPGLSY